MATGGEEHSLSDEQMVTLLQFQEITGVTDEQRSRYILTAFQWSLEAAVQDTLNEQEVQRSRPPPPPQLMGHPQLRRRYPPQMMHQGFVPSPVHMVTRVVARRPPMTWWEWSVSMATLPFRFIYSFSFDFIRFVLTIVVGPRTPPTAQDPVGDVTQFVTRFEGQFGPAHAPLPRASYSQIVEQAKTELRFLLVYLHSWEGEEWEGYTRSIVCSSRFSQLINERNILFWAVDVQSEEGRRVKYVLNGGNYPFMALAMLKQARMTLIGRFEGSLSEELFLQNLVAILDRSEPELVVSRSEREDRQLSQLLRQQQEEAFQQSLRADQEKEERKRAEVEEEKLRYVREEERAKERQADRERRLSLLPPEPEEGCGECVKVMLRSGDGSKLERRFKTSDRLQVVYDFALKFPEIPAQFELVSNYPRRTLVVEKGGGPTLEELGLGHSCVLFVRDATEDEEE